MNLNELLFKDIGEIKDSPSLIRRRAMIKKLAIELKIERLRLKADLLEEVSKELEEWSKNLQCDTVVQKELE